MPGMDGLSFCEYVNGLNRNIKIIIISAYSKFEYAKRGIQLGVYDFLEKPVDYQFLGDRIVQAGKEKQHEEQIQKIYENNHDIYQEALFLRLLKDHRESEKIRQEEVEEILHADMGKMQFNCVAMAVEFAEEGVSKRNICAEFMRRLAETYEDQELWGPFLYETNTYCVVFGKRKSFLNESLVKNLQDSIDFIALSHPEMHINIGIGYWVDDFRKLQFSADASLQALEYRFVFGKNEVFNISDYSEKKLEDYTRFDYFEKKLIKYLECADFKNLRKITGEMKAYIEKQHIGKSYLLFFITDFLSVHVSRRGVKDELEGNDYLSELGKLVYSSEILRYFEEILISLCQVTRKNSTKDTDHVIRKIQKYIEENYRKDNLNLTEIARIFNMSPNYICRIFKEKTGNTLMNYISELRIQAAKLLLVQTDKKIWEISQDLGYSNQYYFSSDFKKATGSSPKNYRYTKETEV